MTELSILAKVFLHNESAKELALLANIAYKAFLKQRANRYNPCLYTEYLDTLDAWEDAAIKMNASFPVVGFKPPARYGYAGDR